MKKYIINFITIILLIFTSSNFVFAEKIVCEVVENTFISVYDKDGNFLRPAWVEMGVCLNLCDNDGNFLRTIWVKTFVTERIRANDNLQKYLNLLSANRIEIDEQDKWYNPLIEYIAQFNNLIFSRLHPDELEQQKTQLNVEIFKILGWKLHELGYGH